MQKCESELFCQKLSPNDLAIGMPVDSYMRSLLPTTLFHQKAPHKLQKFWLFYHLCNINHVEITE